MKLIIYISLQLFGLAVFGQPNCNIYKNPKQNVACERYSLAIALDQGSRASQLMFISSLEAFPTFAPSLHEMSVPYLKRGDFYNWKILIDKAVKYDPVGYLGDRGWCLFKFLKDYENAFNDLNRLYYLTNGQPGYSGDGDYDLRIIMALSQREMGNHEEAIKLFNICINSNEKKNIVGLYDYLARGITLLKTNNYKGALDDFDRQIKKYEKLADTHYYIGLTYLKLNNKKKAIDAFTKAKYLFTKGGYHHSDPYREVPDQIYLSDIMSHLNSIQKKYN